jgi:hypothetical protein
MATTKVKRKTATKKAVVKEAPAVKRQKVTAKDILGDPVLYGMHILGFKFYDWQVNVLRDCEMILANQSKRPNSISLLANNGSGKTSVFVSTLVLWALTAYKGALVVITSGTFRQVSEQLFPNLRRFQHKFKGWTFNDVEITSPHGSHAIGFSASDPGKAEGFHAQSHLDAPLIYIVDEAKTVDDEIYTSIDRCQPTLHILVSSAGGKSGAFYRSHTTERSSYRCHKVTVDDCPHISQEEIQGIINKYGKDHPFTRSTLYSEFMGDDEDCVVSSAIIDRLFSTPQQQNRDPERHVFCDYAAGGDENVIFLREGNKVTMEDAWVEKDTMRACGRFIQNFRRLKITPEESMNVISGDDGGVGHAMNDRFEELGWNINRVNFGGKSGDPKIWANYGSEMWEHGRKQIEDIKVIRPDDPIMREQMVNRKWKRSSDGKLQLESKQDVKARGGHSPDRADGAFGCMMPAPKNRMSLVEYAHKSFFDDDHDDYIEGDELTELGIHA